ncbi:uncharacterized protein LOC135400869 [Ornithodoros turicata]|uniref:uncharacterized protein LOC135400869 n=1 Tax=Ornithodoros turicata TaxID=34597 RepID=UPI00313883F3
MRQEALNMDISMTQPITPGRVSQPAMEDHRVQTSELRRMELDMVTDGQPTANGSKCLHAKRPRTDSDNDNLINDNDSRCSNTENVEHNDENSNMEDDEGFITVVHKKNRKSGIPVILRPVKPDESFLGANPNTVAREVMTATQERIKNHRIASDGSIVITVATLPAAKALLALTSLANIAVTTRVPDSYARNVGRITGLRTRYTDTQLLEFLRPAGAVEVRRQQFFRTNEDGTTKATDSDSVIITFKSDIKMPEHIELGFNTYRVQEYFTPTQKTIKVHTDYVWTCVDSYDFEWKWYGTLWNYMVLKRYAYGLLRCTNGIHMACADFYGGRTGSIESVYGTLWQPFKVRRASLRTSVTAVQVSIQQTSVCTESLGRHRNHI